MKREPKSGEGEGKDLHCDANFASCRVSFSLSIRPSYGARGEEILDGGGGRGSSFTSLPFSLPFFPFSPETPDTQARLALFLDAFTRAV